MLSDSCVRGDGRFDVERSARMSEEKLEGKREELAFKFCKGFGACELVALDDLTRVESHHKKIF
jgi:hypothetical protein